jgi:hypothetical protein
MRKTKCKECKGDGWKILHETKCDQCQDGEISVFTIQELRKGKVAVLNDSTRNHLIKLLEYAFPDNLITLLEYAFPDNPINPGGDGERYCSDPNRPYNWTSHRGYNSNLPTQSVKIFLEEIEKEEKMKQKIVCANKMCDGECIECNHMEKVSVEEPEFKWGKEVEWTSRIDLPYCPGTYLCRHPDKPSEHLIFDSRPGFARDLRSIEFVRKPQKITITLSQIAEAFNCRPEQIVIPELNK